MQTPLDYFIDGEAYFWASHPHTGHLLAFELISGCLPPLPPSLSSFKALADSASIVSHLSTNKHPPGQKFHTVQQIKKYSNPHYTDFKRLIVGQTYPIHLLENHRKLEVVGQRKSKVIGLTDHSQVISSRKCPFAAGCLILGRNLSKIVIK